MKSKKVIPGINIPGNQYLYHEEFTSKTEANEREIFIKRLILNGLSVDFVILPKFQFIYINFAQVLQ